MLVPHNKPKGATLSEEQRRDEFRLVPGLFAMTASAVVALMQLNRLAG